jgi:hypothetical protein
MPGADRPTSPASARPNSITIVAASKVGFSAAVR